MACGGLVETVVGHPLAGRRGVGHAVPEVLVEQPDRHALEGSRRRRDLGQDVDAVGVLVDHALQPAHLALDAPEALQDVGLVVVVAGLDGQGLGHMRHDTP